MTHSIVISADDPSKVVAADTPSHRADAGQAWGTLIHGLLEHAMRQKQASSDDLRRLGMWLTVEQPQLRPVLDLAVNTVLQVSKAEFWNEAKNSECSVETPFAFAESPDQILTGVIDLLFGYQGRWRIIDYKTDVGLTDLVASYQAQLKMYERALASVGITEVTSAIQPVRGAVE
jgi:ATP-dependent exoDNAse (exonuclease V) beta subunit